MLLKIINVRSRFSKWLPVFLIFRLILMGTAYGQACCSGGVPISNMIGVRPADMHQLTIRGTYDGNYLNTFFTGSDRLSDNNVSRYSQTVFIQGIYGITERLSVNVLMNRVHHKRTVTSAYSDGLSTKVSGFGDAILLGQYKLLNFNEASLYLTGGVKIPTGKSEVKDENGILMAADLQPGTGSWDFIAGAGYVKNHFIRPSMSFTSTLVSKLNTYSERYNGQQNYKYGNDFQFLLGITDSFILRSLILNPGLLFRFWHTTPDKIEDISFPNTGGTWIYLAPSVNFQFNALVSAFTSVEIPIYQKLAGSQLSTTVRFALGFQLNISTSKNKLLIPEMKDF